MNEILFLSWTFQLLSSWMWVETLMWKDSSQFSIRASTIELLKPCGCILSRGESSISVTEVMWDGCGKENYQPKDREAGEELWRISSGYYLLPEDVKDGELEYLPTTPEVFTLIYNPRQPMALKGSGKGRRGSRRSMTIYELDILNWQATTGYLPVLETDQFPDIKSYNLVLFYNTRFFFS